MFIIDTFARREFTLGTTPTDTMRSVLKIGNAALGLLSLASRVAAQQSSGLEILAYQYNDPGDNGTQLTISRAGDMIPLSPVLPLTVAADSANLPVSATTTPS